jgi:hypothetical protein
MYLGKVKWDLVQAAREKYLTGLPEGETRSAHINLGELKAFLNEVSVYAEAEHIYPEDVDIVFVRGGIAKPDDWYEKVEGVNLQLNLAFVVKTGEDAFVLEPGGESTGLCPKHCGRI